MDALKHLKLEITGIRGTIDDYTSESNVINMLSKLEEGISKSDIEAIKYCLNELHQWYTNNISAIHSNSYCFHPEQHDRNSELINKFIGEFDGYKIDNEDMSYDKHSDESMIFISHKSDNKKYGDALRDLIIGLGVKNSQLIYTTHPLHKIPLDENIYDYLRGHITSEIFMIILWSDSYLNSPACLNEMGAAWVAQSDYTNIYVPNFSFGNPKYHECAVDTRKMGAVLNGDGNCKASIIELKNKIQEMFKLEDNEQNTSYLIDQFLEAIGV